MIVTDHPDLFGNDYLHDLVYNLSKSNPSVFKKIHRDPMQSVFKDGISFKGGDGKALVDIVEYADDDGESFTQKVYQTLPQQQAEIQYRDNPEQARQIAELTKRLDAFQNKTTPTELQVPDAPEPVRGITQEEVDAQLGNLRQTLGRQYEKQQTAALSSLREQLTGQFATEFSGLRKSFGAQSDKEMQDLRFRLNQQSADRYAALRDTLTSDFQRQLSEATSASEKAMLEQKQAAALQAADYTAQLSEARRKNEAQENLFQTNIDALKTELGMARQNYGSQIEGLRGELSSAREGYRTALSGLEQTIGAQNQRLTEYQAAIKRSQEADIQRQQRARISDAYANPNRQKVTGVKAARSPAFTSTGARRTVSSQFGRSGMRISSLNI
tara:strand:- start:1295 stop:2449 length:1155 start_codon:yes stop_codon:yes gene_type:complete